MSFFKKHILKIGRGAKKQLVTSDGKKITDSDGKYIKVRK